MSALEASLRYLASPAARESLTRDPYWPKWDSPWWHLTLLWEMGEIRRAPASLVDFLVDRINEHYLRVFPLRAEEMPAGCDPYRDVACHCQLGTGYQFLHAYGVDVDKRIPWLRPWFLRYQLPDGGLNCDNDACAKPSPKSSVVSTLPPAEAILFCTDREFTRKEKEFLERAASYLVKRSLFLSSDGEIIDADWLKLCFPRFYEYDVLRGLRFVMEWARRFDRELPEEKLALARAVIEEHRVQGQLAPARPAFAEAKSFQFDGEWKWGDKASLFPLLEGVSRVGVGNKFLTQSSTELFLQVLRQQL